ncbi:MerR family DNA-binding transcriptional regulator [Kitasatospora sp. NPDC001175]|uniref:MerR family DNA-binding transcriptional regulator n=1 Tax=Kitasatospora sp. NPDC001175 TaxID=3157103 RepID=UPI003CFD9598
MKISEVARRAGVTAKTVRYYEALGLIRPARLANGYRDYSEHDARMVAETRALNRLGIPVERTRPFLECLAAGRDQADDCPSSLAGYRDAIEDLTVRIEALTARRAALVRHLRDAAYRNSSAGRPGEKEYTVSDPSRLPVGLPVPEDDGAADHLAGSTVPDLDLPSSAGGTVALRALGEGRSVVYCYPLTGRPDRDMPDGWDNIPGARGCTAEACDFRDHHDDLIAVGAARVFGLSSQETGYQQEVVGRLRLPFAMLSDTGLRLAATIGLPTFDAGGETLYKRITLIIRDGVIEHVFYPIFPPNEHAEQVLRWLKDNPA